jgi:hypothetical protein
MFEITNDARQLAKFSKLLNSTRKDFANEYDLSGWLIA